MLDKIEISGTELMTVRLALKHRIFQLESWETREEAVAGSGSVLNGIRQEIRMSKALEAKILVAMGLQK